MTRGRRAGAGAAGAAPAPSGIAAQGVVVRHGTTVAVDGVDLAVHPGQTVGLVGPNGSGKTSLLRVMAGLARPDVGTAWLDGRPVLSLPGRERAARLAYVGQLEQTEAPFTARDVVSLGRACLRRDWERVDGDDRAAIDAVLDRMGLTALADRRLDQMSGGERQRVLIARALAQGASTIVLDEPTNHLDVSHQQEVMALVADGPETVLVVLHDLDLAAAFCDRVVLLDHGRVVAEGEPAVVLDTDLVERVYRVPATRMDLPHRPHLVLGR